MGIYGVDELEVTDVDSALNDRINGFDYDPKESEDKVGNLNTLYTKHKKQFKSNQNFVSLKRTVKKDRGKIKLIGQYMVFYFRGFVSLQSQFLHFTGSWTFFNQ